MSSDVHFRKGHGTGNDFVLLLDRDDEITITAELAAALCDRRFGLGGDGVIRVAPDGDGHWFMDYWNSDGSIGVMCGNGARVFARHLVDLGWQSAGEFEFTTRGGLRRAVVPSQGDVSIHMGPVVPVGVDDITVSRGDQTWSAIGALAPNPHAVVFLPTLTGLGDIASAVAGPEAAYPTGANIEFVAVQAPDRVDLRVLERGSGETLSCGTGACAVAWAHSQVHAGVPDTVIVGVPGGEVTVTLGPDVVLSGPTEFVAEGIVDPHWWQAHT